MHLYIQGYHGGIIFQPETYIMSEEEAEEAGVDIDKEIIPN